MQKYTFIPNRTKFSAQKSDFQLFFSHTLCTTARKSRPSVNMLKNETYILRNRSRHLTTTEKYLSAIENYLTVIKKYLTVIKKYLTTLL